ncbi:hypothetical protein ACP70R_011686 [Stipagrostis hirtigluma subsp. patula]
MKTNKNHRTSPRPISSTGEHGRLRKRNKITEVGNRYVQKEDHNKYTHRDIPIRIADTTAIGYDNFIFVDALSLFVS